MFEARDGNVHGGQPAGEALAPAEAGRREYPDEHLAELSYGLRTSLNSLLILAKLLNDNAGNSMSPKQLDYARAIYAAATEMLSQVNRLLNRAKRHRLAQLPGEQGSLHANRAGPVAAHGADPRLAGRRVLIVDDDAKSAFALTSALEQSGMKVLNAESGGEGLRALKSTPGIDIVVMDIMMDELDGYDTIRLVRGMAQFKDLPIIAVTAKALQGDREKCIAAGASDYLAKPVNVEQLASLLRNWLNP